MSSRNETNKAGLYAEFEVSLYLARLLIKIRALYLSPAAPLCVAERITTHSVCSTWLRNVFACVMSHHT